MITQSNKIYTALAITTICLMLFSCKQDEPRACFRLSTDYIFVDSTVHFMDCSEGADSYYWDFGDSTFSTEAAPSHVYTESDYYNVSLTVEGKSGQSDYTSHQIAVYVLTDE